jgi:hypothetical protein
MRLVALTGKAGVGKDTVGAILHRHHGFATQSFAGPLKAALADLLEVPRSLWEDRGWKERPLPDLGVSPRRLAQTLGTEWGREMIHPDLWVKLAARRWASYKERAKHVVQTHNDWTTPIVMPGLVFTDCRFDNEADWVRSEGGLVVHVIRVNVAEVESHKSEEGVRRYKGDRYIVNDGTIEDLKPEVAHLVRYMQQ